MLRHFVDRVIKATRPMFVADQVKKTAKVLVMGIGGLVVFVARATLLASPDPSSSEMGGADVPARILYNVKPEYPQHLLDDGIHLRAFVAVALTLDASGKADRVDVVSASHPAFVAPTVVALLRMKFAPALRAGKPVPSVFNLTQGFDVLAGYQLTGADPERTPRKPNGLPPNLDYDVPPELMSFCDPAVPRELLLAGVRGAAEVRFVIDPTGRVSEAEASKASRPEFGAALVAAIETWRFRAAQRARKPVTTVLVQQQKFLAADIHRSESEQRVLRQLRRGESDFVACDALDRPLRAVYQVPPQYPRALERQGTSGDAVVEFIVDRDGQAMLPRVVSASRPEFGCAAATAVQQWFYEPPTANGQFVDVHVTMPFEFKPLKLAK